MRKFVDPLLGVYLALGCLGLFARPGLSDSFFSLAGLYVWIAGYLLLLFRVSFEFIFITRDAQLHPLPFRFILLGIIFMNFIIQVTGGAHSTLWSAYYFFAVVFAALSRLPQAAGMALIVLAIEGTSLFITDQVDPSRWQTYAGFGLSLTGVSAATSFIMGFVLKEADQAKEAHDRLLEKAEAVNPLADPATLEALMPLSRQAANLKTAQDREESFSGLLSMMLLIVPVHTYALFVKERRDGAEQFVLRARKTASENAVVPVGTALDPAAGRTGIDLCAERKTAHYLPELTDDTVSFLGYYVRGAKNVPVQSAVIIPILSKDGESVVAVLAADKVTADSFSNDTQEMLKRFSAFFLEVIENSQLSLDLKARADHFGALHAISADLNSSLSFSDIMAQVIPQIKKIVPFDHCACLLKSEVDGKTLMQLTALDGYSPEMTGRTFAIEESAIITRVYHDWQNRLPRGQDRDTTVYYDRDCGERGKEIGLFPFKELQLPIQSLYAKLLVPNEKFIGLFILASRRTDAFSEYHREYLLDTLMNQIGQVANNAQLHRQIADLARTDGLTGLLNHRTFMELLNAKYRELERKPRPFSILLMDIDRFKTVNDRYGHPVGDIAIKKVADILHATIRGTDFVARYGGEEFAVGMVETDRKGAEQMAERIRVLMERTVVTRVPDGELKCTLSIGVATFPDDTNERAGLVAMADEALYHAKRTGRNRVSLYRDVVNDPAQNSQP